jgi:MoxR-like ATPase
MSEEMYILSAQQYEHPIMNTFQVVSVQELVAAQHAVREVYAADEIKRYIIELVNATRQHPDVYLGSSPRGSLALFRTSQARAAMAGRDYVIPDDVKALAEVALAHRIIVGPAARIKDISSRTIVQDILASTPVPGASAR